MSFGFIASGSGGSTDGRSAVTTSFDSTGAGALFVFVGSDGNVGLPDVFDNKGNNLLPAITVVAGFNGSFIRNTLYYVEPTTVGAGHTVSVLDRGFRYPTVHALAFSCASHLRLVDVSTVNGGGLTTTLAPGSLTPSAANALIVAAAATTGGTITAVGGSFTGLTATALVGGQHFGLGSAYLIQTSAAASNPTFTNNAAVYLGLIQAAFLDGGSAGELRESQLALETATRPAVGEQRASQLSLESMVASIGGHVGEQRTSQLVLETLVFASGVVTVDPPPEDCTVDSPQGSGGRGANGCNPGGTGWTSSYAGPFGSVPDYTDIEVGEVLTDKKGVEVWIELVHGTGGEVVRRAQVALGDTNFGGRKPGGLLGVGTIEHALGNEQGGYEPATLSLTFSDADLGGGGSLFRAGIGNKEDFEGDEVRIKLASDALRGIT